MEELANNIYEGLRRCSILTNKPEMLAEADQKRNEGTWVDAAIEMHLRENPQMLKWSALDFFVDSHQDAVAAETGLSGIDLDAEMQARWLDEVLMHGEVNARRRHAPLMACSKFCERRPCPKKKSRRDADPDLDLSTMPPAEMTIAQLRLELDRSAADSRSGSKPELIARLIHARQNE